MDFTITAVTGGNFVNEFNLPPARPRHLSIPHPQSMGEPLRLHDPHYDEEGQSLPFHKAGNPKPDPSSKSAKSLHEHAMKEAITRARNGDESVMPELRTLMAEFPLERFGDLSQSIIRRMLDNHFKNNLFSNEVIQQKLVDLRSELEGRKPSPIEKLIVDRVLCCWLRLQLAELAASGEDVCDNPFSRIDSRSLDRYHKQYLSALKALADLRRLNVTIQLSVAKRDVLRNNAAPTCL